MYLNLWHLEHCVGIMQCIHKKLYSKIITLSTSFAYIFSQEPPIDVGFALKWPWKIAKYLSYHGMSNISFSWKSLLESKTLPPSVSLQETRYWVGLATIRFSPGIKKNLTQLLKFISQPCAICTLLLACTNPLRSNSPPGYSWYL